MLTREELSKLKKRFWDGLAARMGKHENALGNRIKWVRYKTGNKSVFLRMEAEKNGAFFCIDIQTNNEFKRLLLFERFEEFKNLLEKEMETPMIWVENHSLSSGVLVSRIFCHKEGLDFFNEKDWPKFYRFLSACLIKFDRFWCEFKDGFDGFD